MTQDDLLVSIIVPVYNSREYLRSCIDSVLRQDYSNIEVIIVDDGSDDGSETMCDEYMAQDARIRVIHQPNAGHVQARRTGLRHARGDAVMWIDSDDWVAADWVSSYVDLMKQSDADIVISGTTDAILRAPADMVAFLLARGPYVVGVLCASGPVQRVGFRRRDDRRGRAYAAAAHITGRAHVPDAGEPRIPLS